MKLKQIISLGLLSLLSCSMVSAQVPRGPQGMQAKTITLNKAEFDQSLSNAVGPKVMGYQYVLIKDGKLVTEKAGGLAQTSKDNGPLSMTTKTPLNIGSLHKFVTGTALINMMEHPTKWSPGEHQNLRNRLDSAIWGQFPNLWLDLVPPPTVSCPQIRCIKYRQLLQHRAGFNDNKEYNRTVMGFLGESDGFLKSQYDKRQYSNINFVLTGYLLPVYERDYFVNELMDVVINYPTQSADQYIRDQLGKRYDQILRERIFDRMTPRINPSCDGARQLAATAAYGYQTKSDNKRGIITSQIFKKGHCTGEGGYYWSARDFANYVAHFSASNLIVSEAGREMMFTEGMPADDRLVWSSARSDDWMKTKFRMPVIVSSNGIIDGSRAVLVRLPENHYLILFTNSEDMSATALLDAGIAAFKAGMAHNFS